MFFVTSYGGHRWHRCGLWQTGSGGGPAARLGADGLAGPAIAGQLLCRNFVLLT
jgi:hypothetical protein